MCARGREGGHGADAPSLESPAASCERPAQGTGKRWGRSREALQTLLIGVGVAAVTHSGPDWPPLRVLVAVLAAHAPQWMKNHKNCANKINETMYHTGILWRVFLYYCFSENQYNSCLSEYTAIPKNASLIFLTLTLSYNILSWKLVTQKMQGRYTKSFWAIVIRPDYIQRGSKECSKFLQCSDFVVKFGLICGSYTWIWDIYVYTCIIKVLM